MLHSQEMDEHKHNEGTETSSESDDRSKHIEEPSDMAEEQDRRWKITKSIATGTGSL